MQRNPTIPALAVVLTAALPAIAAGEGLELDPSSVFAVVTGKAGLAKGLAHEHLVTAHGASVELVFDPERLDDVRFSFEAATEQLLIDDPEEKAALGETLREAKVTTEPFAEISVKDRKKIRDSMLAKDQLDAAGHPTITAALSGLEREKDGGSSAKGELELTVVGKKVSRPVGVAWESKDGKLTLRAHGTFKFTDFGIKPYSAAMGTVKVADELHVWVRLVAKSP